MLSPIFIPASFTALMLDLILLRKPFPVLLKNFAVTGIDVDGDGSNRIEFHEVKGFRHYAISEESGIEVIYNEKGAEVVLESDGWTISTKNGRISGLFEKTIAITKNGPLVLTPMDFL